MARPHWQYFMMLPTLAIVCPAYAVDYLTVEQAQKALFPSADQFVRREISLNDDQLSKIKALAGVRQRSSTPQVWRAVKKTESKDAHKIVAKSPTKVSDSALPESSELVGLFIVDEVVGKHEYITYSAALSPEGKVIGIEILSYRETHGGEVRGAPWRKTLVGKKLSDPFKLDVDVPNISGATLSCRNVMDGVKRLLALQQVIGNA